MRLSRKCFQMRLEPLWTSHNCLRIERNFLSARTMIQSAGSQYFRNIMLGLLMYFPINFAINSSLDTTLYSARDFSLAASHEIYQHILSLKKSPDPCLKPLMTPPSG